MANPTHGQNKRPSNYEKSDSIRDFKIKQAVDPTRFNFNKASHGEDLLNFETEDGDTHMIKVNVSPILNGHCLYIPFANRCLPQVIDDVRILENILLEIYPEVCLRQNCLIGFNSIGAFSSINHLHFHFIPISQLEEYQPNPWESVGSPDYWPEGMVTRLTVDAACLDQTVASLFSLVSACNQSNTPYNIVITT